MATLRKALTCLLAAGPLALAASAQRSDAEQGFVDWACERAIPVGLDADARIPPELLRSLLEGKRFVFLGEPDHFIAEKYAFRMLLIRQLHALGWREVGMEMGRSDGLRLDRYLQTGDEEHLSSLGLYGGFRRRVSPVSGSGGFLEREFQFARDLRALGAGDERIRYFGYDVDVVRSKGTEDALVRLQGIDAADELIEIIETLPASAPAIADLEALAGELGQARTELARSLTERMRLAICADLDGMAESLRFQRTLQNGILNVSRDAFARRETLMFRHFDRRVAALPADEPLILMGHNLHLSRSWEGVEWTDHGDENALWRTIGSHVVERFPDEVLSIWLVYDRGEHLDALPPLPVMPVDSVPGTMESLLAEVPHESFLLPLASDDPHAAWLSEDRPIRVNGFVGHGVVTEMADVLFFVRTVSPP